MFRIDTPNKVVDLFGAGKHGFKDGDKALGINPTELSAAQQNALQEEILGVIEAAGVVPNKANNAQLVESIQRLIDAQSGNYALDTGAANAYLIALNPAIAAYADGMTVRFKVVNANTGAATLNAGGGVIPLVNDVGGALAAGDLPAGSVLAATYIASANKFYITSMVQSQVVKPQVANSTTPQAASFTNANFVNVAQVTLVLLKQSTVLLSASMDAFCAIAGKSYIAQLRQGAEVLVSSPYCSMPSVSLRGATSVPWGIENLAPGTYNFYLYATGTTDDSTISVGNVVLTVIAI